MIRVPVVKAVTKPQVGAAVVAAVAAVASPAVLDAAVVEDAAGLIGRAYSKNCRIAYDTLEAVYKVDKKSLIPILNALHGVTFGAEKTPADALVCRKNGGQPRREHRAFACNSDRWPVIIAANREELLADLK